LPFPSIRGPWQYPEWSHSSSLLCPQEHERLEGNVRIQLLLVVTLSGSASLIAQSTLPSPGRPDARRRAITNGASPDQLNRQSKNQYENLLTLDYKAPSEKLGPRKGSRRELTSTPPGASAAKEKVICGLTVWNVGPELDPRMVTRAPADNRVDFKIQKIAPAVCAE
jgi:hypothetical protein